ncbi:MAG: 6-phosphogluconolactonase [Sulfuricaulis sp.]
MPADARLIVVATEVLPEVAAQHIARVLKQAIARRGRASVALAGGSTPRAVYRRLAQISLLAWENVEIYFGDERAVPPTDPQSNYRMARESLLDAVPIPSGQIHRMPAERTDREAAAAEYAAQLPERLDLIILGIGEDGHTASLFPGSAALHEGTRRVLAIMGSKPPPWRMSVTPSVLAAAMDIIVLACGSRKSAAVAQALEGCFEPDKCPAQLARDAIWILDPAAAAALRLRPS